LCIGELGPDDVHRFPFRLRLLAWHHGGTV
jgi:hypothetical protein